MSNTRSATHYGLWSLILGLGFLLTWAAFAPMDEGVPAQGLVTLDTKRKAIQHCDEQREARHIKAPCQLIGN